MCGKEYDILHRLISEGDPKKAAGVEMGSSPTRKGKGKCKGPEAGECPVGLESSEVGGEEVRRVRLGLPVGVRLVGSVEKFGLRFGGRWKAWDSSE